MCDKNENAVKFKDTSYAWGQNRPLLYTLASKSLTWNINTWSSGCNVLAFYVLYVYIHANSGIKSYNCQPF